MKHVTLIDEIIALSTARREANRQHTAEIERLKAALQDTIAAMDAETDDAGSESKYIELTGKAAYYRDRIAKLEQKVAGKDLTYEEAVTYEKMLHEAYAEDLAPLFEQLRGLIRQSEAVLEQMEEISLKTCELLTVTVEAYTAGGKTRSVALPKYNLPTILVNWREHLPVVSDAASY